MQREPMQEPVPLESVELALASRRLFQVHFGRVALTGDLMSEQNAAPTVSSNGVDQQMARVVLGQIRSARVKSTREGQIKAGRKSGMTYIVIPAAGVIGK